MHMSSHRSQIVFRILKGGAGEKFTFLLFLTFFDRKSKKRNSSLQTEAIFYFFTFLGRCCVFFCRPRRPKIRIFEIKTKTNAFDANESTYEHTNIRTYDHTNIRPYDHTTIRPYEHTHIRTYAHTHIRTYEQTNRRTDQHLMLNSNIRTHTFKNFNISGTKSQVRIFNIH